MALVFHLIPLRGSHAGQSCLAMIGINAQRHDDASHKDDVAEDEPPDDASRDMAICGFEDHNSGERAGERGQSRNEKCCHDYKFSL